MVQAGVWAARLSGQIHMRRLVLTVMSRIIYSPSTRSPSVSAVGTRMTKPRHQLIANEERPHPCFIMSKKFFRI